MSELPFWSDDVLIAEFINREGTSTGVRLRVHHAIESFDTWERDAEITSLSETSGDRHYVLVRPYFARHRNSSSSDGMSRGERSTTLRGTDLTEPDATRLQEHLWTPHFGSGQAWYYPQDRTLVLWEVDLHPGYATQPQPAKNSLLTGVWRGFEEYLLTRFPQTAQIATPAWESEYSTPAWQAFLRGMGYRQASSYAFTKSHG